MKLPKDVKSSQKIVASEFLAIPAASGRYRPIFYFFVISKNRKFHWGSSIDAESFFFTTCFFGPFYAHYRTIKHHF